MILIRYLLICIIGYLVIRVFLKSGNESHSATKNTVEDKQPLSKKISGKIGEYVDYEEVKAKKEKKQK